jgi:hypothetical protein
LLIAIKEDFNEKANNCWQLENVQELRRSA